MVGGAIGYKINNRLRAEISPSYRKVDSTIITPISNRKIKGTHRDVCAIFFNGYFDVPTRTIFTPYLTAGVGLNNYSKTNIPDEFDPKGSGISFAYNLGFGFQTKVTEATAINAELRFLPLKNPVGLLVETAVGLMYKF